MTVTGNDTLKARRTLTVNGASYDYFSLKAAEAAGMGDTTRLPFSIKVLLENMLRYEDGRSVTVDDVKATASWNGNPSASEEIAFRPARVLLQDLTGVPAVVDLAAMREAMLKMGGNAQKINPLCPVDLVIDHSVMIDNFGTPDAFEKNVKLEFTRNQERDGHWNVQRFGGQAGHDVAATSLELPSDSPVSTVVIRYQGRSGLVDVGTSSPAASINSDRLATLREPASSRQTSASS